MAPYGKSMKKSTGKKHVLLVIESSRAYGRGIIQGVTRYVEHHGRWTVGFEEQGVLTNIPTWLKDWKGDGIICRTGNSPLGRHLRTLCGPIVELLGDGVRYISEVQSDAEKTAELAAEHLCNLGLRHFAYYSYGNVWWGGLRGERFAGALRRRGFTCDILISRSGRQQLSFPLWQSTFEGALLRWLKQLPKPIGIWTAADTVAKRVHESCSKLAISVPDQVALLGVDNDAHLCNVLTPSLSSIDPNPVMVGYRAAQLLDQKMHREKLPPLPIRIPPLGIVTRQSTDMIAADDPEMIRLARFIRENALTGLRVADVVRQSDLSKRTLERRFKKCFGRTIDHEIVQLKMEHAKKLLLETVLSVGEIGSRSGFDANYFIKAFRRVVGLSPSEFRKKFQVAGRDPSLR